MNQLVSPIASYRASLTLSGDDDQGIRSALECGRAAASLFKSRFLKSREVVAVLAEKTMMAQCPREHLRVAIATFNLELWSDEIAWASTNTGCEVYVRLSSEENRNE